MKAIVQACQGERNCRGGKRSWRGVEEEKGAGGREVVGKGEEEK